MNTVCEHPHPTFLHIEETGTDIILSLIYEQEGQNVEEIAPIYVLKKKERV